MVEWAEFAFSLMGEKALQFGTLADLEILNSLLDETATWLSTLKDDLQSSQMYTAERTERNAELRKRMANMKKEMGGKMQNMMSKMMGVFGLDPMELLTDDEINKLLSATFAKFDKDGSGELEGPEVRSACLAQVYENAS